MLFACFDGGGAWFEALELAVDFPPCFEFFDGGVGTDTIEMGKPVADLSSWLHMTTGSYTISGDTITLSADATGYVTLDDGSLCTFENLEQIHLV